MKKGINIWSFPGDMNAAACIELAKQAGFDGLELALNETGELGLDCTEKALLEAKKRAQEAGVDLPSLATGLYWSYPMTSSRPAIRQKGLDIAKKQLEAAAILGADTILVVPGAVGADFVSGSEIVSYDAAYDRALEAMFQLKAEAEACKVAIGIENVWNKFLLSPLEMRSFIDTINSPYVGAYLDVGNVIAYGYPEQWVTILGYRIKKVHFKDFRRSVGTLSGFVDLLSGDVDYPAVIAALKATGYDDYCTAEMIPAYQHHPEQILYNTSAAMDKIFGGA